ncbi:hypothetical protein DW1_1853 [Proteiniborus sp. DW1]|uniref:hypothetical protein n=1 Tax=Proteiniborus sp. DW1 TaxID=1889883 RepID=UPI00092E1A85|nr:hypothetical protein [Proteiniborus sp. DW1]SCG83421.1 hypothetical protein DW1_1853 [Proteiniborus sp. DW1]
MRPIDLNNQVPNAQLISKVQQVENNKQRFFVQDQTVMQNKKFKRELKKVNTTDKVYKIKINKEQKSNKEQKRNKYNKFEENESMTSQDKNDKNIDKKEKAILSETIGTKIDIKI